MDAPSLESLFACEVALERGDPRVVEGALHPLEAPLLEGVAESRRRELVASRVLARRALARLGVAGGPILRGEDRAPVWPPGVVGSITHADGMCAVVVARRERALGLGLDLEEPRRMKERLLPRICTPRELALLEGEEPGRRLLLGALSFSAKESVYKCQHPLANRWLGFHDVELELDLEHGSFRATTVAGLAPLWPEDARARGRFILGERHLATAVTLLGR